VSQSTRDLLTGSDDLVFVDEITLRGRTSPTRLWGLEQKEFA
jgi:class 3 adenylate cyclase